MLKIGDKNKDVEALQAYLTHYQLGVNPLVVDGQFGNATQQALIRFQLDKGLTADGIYGDASKMALEAFIAASKKFVVSIHGGHGGMNLDGTYATPPSVGKKYRHPTCTTLHTKDGWFLEGVENRIAANEVAKQLRLLGIFVLVTHDEIKDDHNNLSRHSKATAPYIKLGYAGYTHAFHSNAAPTDVQAPNGDFIRKRTKAELDAIIGCYNFTSVGNTFSDKVSAIHLNNLKKEFDKWIRLRSKGEIANSNSDVEKNLQVLRDIEKLCATYKNFQFGAILTENGFMTSELDVEFVTNPKTRKKYVDASVLTALMVKELIYKLT